MADENRALVIRAKKGDKSAFGELYKIFLTRIYRFVLYLVYDSYLAEDITQDAFVKVWKALPKFSTRKGTFQSFIYAVARNLVIDHQRKKKAVHLSLEFGESIESHDNHEERLVADEQMKEVHKALSFLPEFDRQLVILRFFEELSFFEISKVVNKKEGAVRVRVHRVLKSLKEEFSEYE